MRERCCGECSKFAPWRIAEGPGWDGLCLNDCADIDAEGRVEFSGDCSVPVNEDEGGECPNYEER